VNGWCQTAVLILCQNTEDLSSAMYMWLAGPFDFSLSPLGVFAKQLHIICFL
jgi:hypothetical protein